MSWEEATKIWAELTGPDDGFYLYCFTVFLLMSLSLSLCGFVHVHVCVYGAMWLEMRHRNLGTLG